MLNSGAKGLLTDTFSITGTRGAPRSRAGGAMAEGEDENSCTWCTTARLLPLERLWTGEAKPANWPSGCE